MKPLSIALGLSLGLLAACVRYHPADPRADYGAPPQGYEELIRAYYRDRLFDPFSAVFEFQEPVKAYWNASFAGSHKSWYGYLVHVRFNAKNRMGGYVGWKEAVVLFRNGKMKVYDGPRPPGIFELKP